MSAFKTRTLEDICDRSRPFPVVDGPFGTQLRADEYKLQGVPLVRVTNLSFEGRFRLEDLVFISEEKASEIQRSEVIREDLIVAKTGATIGKCGLFPFNRGVIASSCIKISVDRTKADPRFLLYRVVSPEGQKAILDGAGGSTRTTINIGPFKQIAFPFPKPAEQSRIAAVLDTVDEAIAKTEAVIAKLKQVRACLLHDLLTRGLDENGKLRDPERHPEQFQDSPLGRIPREWEVLSIEALLARVPNALRSGPFGSALLKQELKPSGIPLLGIDNVHVERFVASYSRFVDRDKFEELRRYAVRPLDVMITIMGTVGRCCVVPNTVGTALSSKHVWTITFDSDRYSPHLACWQMNHAPWVLRQLRRDEQGGVMTAIRSETLRGLLLPVPQPYEIRAIEAVLQESTYRIAAEEALLPKLVAMKSGLMADLLTGRVRVPESISAVENQS